jgi:hypothetical protein
MVGESFHQSGCRGEDDDHIRLGATVQTVAPFRFLKSFFYPRYPRQHFAHLWRGEIIAILRPKRIGLIMEEAQTDKIFAAIPKAPEHNPV